MPFRRQAEPSSDPVRFGRCARGRVGELRSACSRRRPSTIDHAAERNSAWVASAARWCTSIRAPCGSARSAGTPRASAPEGHRIVVEVPEHGDQLGRCDDLVVPTHAGPPLHRSREPPVPDGYGHAQPLRGTLVTAGEGLERPLLVERHVGRHRDPLLHRRLSQRAFGKVVGRLPSLVRRGEERQHVRHRAAVGSVATEVAVGTYDDQPCLAQCRQVCGDRAPA